MVLFRAPCRAPLFPQGTTAACSLQPPVAGAGQGEKTDLAQGRDFVRISVFGCTDSVAPANKNESSSEFLPKDVSFGLEIVRARQRMLHAADELLHPKRFRQERKAAHLLRECAAVPGNKQDWQIGPES
jgi:hypothetical protein